MWPLIRLKDSLSFVSRNSVHNAKGPTFYGRNWEMCEETKKKTSCRSQMCHIFSSLSKCLTHKQISCNIKSMCECVWQYLCLYNIIAFETVEISWEAAQSCLTQTWRRRHVLVLEGELSCNSRRVHSSRKDLTPWNQAYGSTPSLHTVV